MKRKNDVDLLIYSKWCLGCTPSVDLDLINLWATKNELDVKLIRTAYRPKDHERATELWAAKTGLDLEDEEQNERAQNYPTFVLFDDVIEIKEFTKMIKDCKNKMVKKGKTKNDVQGLSKTKRSKRKNGMGLAVDKATRKNEEQEVEE